MKMRIRVRGPAGERLAILARLEQRRIQGRAGMRHHWLLTGPWGFKARLARAGRRRWRIWEREHLRDEDAAQAESWPSVAQAARAAWNRHVSIGSPSVAR